MLPPTALETEQVKVIGIFYQSDEPIYYFVVFNVWHHYFWMLNFYLWKDVPSKRKDVVTSKTATGFNLCTVIPKIIVKCQVTVNVMWLLC